MALSPDGTRLAFIAANPEGKYMLWIRPLSGMAAQPLAGTERASYPFWSPDSRFVGFFAGGKLKKIDASGGPPQTLATRSSRAGNLELRRGDPVCADSAGAFSRVSAAGGTAVTVTALDASKREFSHRFPHFLPDGRHFVFLAQAIPSGDLKDADVVYAAALDSKSEGRSFDSDPTRSMCPPFGGGSQGHLLFARERTVVAQSSDPKSLSLSGEPVPVSEAVAFYPNFGCAMFTTSHTGILAYQSGGAEGSRARLARPFGQAALDGGRRPGLSEAADLSRWAANRGRHPRCDDWPSRRMDLRPRAQRRDAPDVRTHGQQQSDLVAGRQQDCVYLQSKRHRHDSMTKPSSEPATTSPSLSIQRASR